MNQQTNRRSFLKAASLSAAALTLPQFLPLDAMAAEKSKKIKLTKGDIILFQGDSITDAGRSKTDKNFNTSAVLGSGYAFLAGCALLKNYADLDLKIYNRGISGNKVYQLADRWDADCIDLKPTVLSVMIGVNDYWHTLTNKYTGTVETYKKDLKALLDRTKQKLPGVQLIICQPFAIKGTRSVNDSWFPAFTAYQDAAHEIATEFNAVYIPFQAAFEEGMKHAPGPYWTADGVHPSLAGSELMAEAWMKGVK